MSEGTIKASARRLGGIAGIQAILDSASRPAPSPKVPAAGDKMRISSTATAAARQAAGGATALGQVKAIDSSVSALQGGRDKVLADIRSLEASKAQAMSQLEIDRQRLASAQAGSATAQTDLDALRKAVAGDRDQLKQISARLDTLHGQASDLSGQAKALGTTQRQDYEAAYGASNYLHYLDSLKSSAVPEGARAAAQAQADGSDATSAQAALAQDEASIRTNNARRTAIAKALESALADRAGASKRLASDSSSAQDAASKLAGANAKVQDAGQAFNAAQGNLYHVDDRLGIDDKQVRGLQSQIDDLQAQRKTLLVSAIGGDQSQIAALDRQIADLESQKADTEKDLAALEALRQ